MRVSETIPMFSQITRKGSSRPTSGCGEGQAHSLTKYAYPSRTTLHGHLEGISVQTKPHFNATLAASVVIVVAIVVTAASVLAQMASGSSISGTVTATRGPNPAVLPPIVGATVVAQPGDYKAVTDSKGAYSISLPPGSYKLIFSAAGFESETQSVTVASSTARITANAALFATPSGKPIAAIKAGGRAPIQGPVSYGSSVSIDISGSRTCPPPAYAGRYGMPWATW